MPQFEFDRLLVHYKSLLFLLEQIQPFIPRTYKKDFGKLKFDIQNAKDQLRKTKPKTKKEKPEVKKERNKAKEVDREFVKEVYNFFCIKCGKPDKVSKLTIHHIIKLCDGGTNELSNLCCLCQKCHNLWHEKYEEKGWDFWDWIEGWADERK